MSDHEPCAECSDLLMMDVEARCGSTLSMDGREMWSVECPMCHATSGWHRLRSEAWAAWDEMQRGLEDK